MITIPNFTQLIWPTLRVLKSKGGSATNEELLAAIVDDEHIPLEAQAITLKGSRQSKLQNNLSWAKVYLKRDGAIESSTRGVWSITSKGMALTQEDIAGLAARTRKQPAINRQLKDDLENGDAAEVDEREAEISSSSWKDELLDVLRRLQPSAFERLAQRMLREAGFIKVEVTGRSGDGGIDGVGVLRVNLLSFQVLFQCKRYQGSVGSGAIRDFRGAMVGRSDKGLFITTGTFTAEATREATRDGAPTIDLIDGDQLCDLLRQLKLGVGSEMIEKTTIDPDWFGSL
jgi:restriction system protein